MTILLLAEREPVEVRAPDEPLNDHPARRGGTEHVGNRGTRAVEQLAGVTPPVGKHE